MLFIDEKSGVDKEALREYVLGKLKDLLATTEGLLHDEKSSKFWDAAKNSLTEIEDENEKEEFESALEQVVEVDQFIKSWIQNSVESSERFEFFILTKAEEVSSGDQAKDYFWAMQIRHDQLVALVRVLEKLVEHMNEWLQIKPNELFNSPVFAGLCEYGLEDQVYLEAESIAKQKNKFLE